MADPPPDSTESPTTTTNSSTTFETAVSQELLHLSRVHPTPKDIPTCLTLFNTWLACASGKSQLKHVYRFGHKEDCTGKSKDYRFVCWKLAMREPEEKRRLWLEWRARWWAERRLSGSSEDVWDIRR
jgi:Protein of unknown function (DUF3128)